MAASSTMGFVRTLGSTASAPGISPHWHSLALFLNISEVGLGALEFPAVDRLSSLAGVLERNLFRKISHVFALPKIAAPAKAHTRRYEPRERALFALSMAVAAYRTILSLGVVVARNVPTVNLQFWMRCAVASAKS
jgi:hypothetical protein